MSPNRQQFRPDVVDCPECLGSGVDKKAVCWKCGGFGEVPNPNPPMVTEPDTVEGPAPCPDKVDWPGELDVEGQPV